MPKEWEERMDPATGELFFFNRTTGEEMADNPVLVYYY
jgi:hypothetical protein